MTLSRALLCLFLAVPAEAAEKPTLLMGPDQGGLAQILGAEGYAVKDVSQNWRPLHASVVFDIEEPLPKFTDATLTAECQQGAAACRARAGVPPKRSRQEAVYCGLELRDALWQRYLDRLAPQGIYLEGDLGHDDPKKDWSPSATSYRVDEPGRRTLKGTAKSEPEARKVLLELARKVLAGGGELGMRVIVRKLPAASAAALAAADSAVPEYPALPYPAACTVELPKALTIESGERFGKTLAARWSATIAPAKKKGPARACTLVYASADVEMMGTAMVSGKATLTCGEKTFAASKSAYNKPQAEDQVSKALIEAALEGWCGIVIEPPKRVDEDE